MKVAVIGTWHVHAPQYTKVALNLGEVVGVYEENAEWRAEFAKNHIVSPVTLKSFWRNTRTTSSSTRRQRKHLTSLA